MNPDEQNKSITKLAEALTKHLNFRDSLLHHLLERRTELEGEIASEALAGNKYKENCARHALAEITILENKFPECAPPPGRPD